MDDFRKFLNKQLEDSDFRKGWDEMEPEYQIMKAMIAARMETGITQQQLSEKTGINQSNLSRIENGNGNPSVSTLHRIASALGKNSRFPLFDWRKYINQVMASKRFFIIFIYSYGGEYPNDSGGFNYRSYFLLSVIICINDCRLRILMSELAIGQLKTCAV